MDCEDKSVDGKIVVASSGEATNMAAEEPNSFSETKGLQPTTSTSYKTFIKQTAKHDEFQSKKQEAIDLVKLLKIKLDFLCNLSVHPYMQTESKSSDRNEDDSLIEKYKLENERLNEEIKRLESLLNKKKQRLMEMAVKFENTQEQLERLVNRYCRAYRS